MISLIPLSWCQPYITSETSVPQGRKCYSKRILLRNACMLLCIMNNFANCKITDYARSADLKYILLWTPENYSPVSHWKNGQEKFLEKGCAFSNCYLTSRKDFFDYGDLRNFDAIIFNGRNLKDISKFTAPQQRTYYQKYIFLNLESSENDPICNSAFDGFFNWTATYKLNSDINIPYMRIMNSSGDEVGPRADMTWLKNMSAFNETLLQSFSGKTKAAAWFVSHCSTRGKREKYAENLKKELKKLNLILDVYGRCGNKVCPRNNQDKCNALLRNTYYFYLSFENSFAEDYVTEKLNTALMNDVVPIVYGGANYSRFLPPGSYIDARKHEPKALATMMAHLIRTPAAYSEFFRWRNHYSYHRDLNVCNLCAALNNQTMLDTHSEYQEFRRWWNPDYEHRCKDKSWGS